MEKIAHTPEIEPSINEALATMNGIFGMIQQLGRNDSEIPTAQNLLSQVQKQEISPKEGVLAMQALLDSKQVH